MSDLERKRLSLTVACAVVGWLITAGGFVWWVATTHASTDSAVAVNSAKGADHEDRLRNLEAVVRDVASDIRWIRQSMEKRKP